MIITDRRTGGWRVTCERCRVRGAAGTAPPSIPALEIVSVAAAELRTMGWRELARRGRGGDKGDWECPDCIAKPPPTGMGPSAGWPNK